MACAGLFFALGVMPINKEKICLKNPFTKTTEEKEKKDNKDDDDNDNGDSDEDATKIMPEQREETKKEESKDIEA